MGVSFFLVGDPPNWGFPFGFPSKPRKQSRHPQKDTPYWFKSVRINLGLSNSEAHPGYHSKRAWSPSVRCLASWHAPLSFFRNPPGLFTLKDRRQSTDHFLWARSAVMLKGKLGSLLCIERVGHSIISLRVNAFCQESQYNHSIALDNLLASVGMDESLWDKPQNWCMSRIWSTRFPPI